LKVVEDCLRVEAAKCKVEGSKLKVEGLKVAKIDGRFFYNYLMIE
jgi:hypothetical protein